jgi:hypothetical protein
MKGTENTHLFEQDVLDSYEEFDESLFLLLSFFNVLETEIHDVSPRLKQKHVSQLLCSALLQSLTNGNEVLQGLCHFQPFNVKMT